jgi:pimeloyl-ACP methyl ester carboxylesterase
VRPAGSVVWRPCGNIQCGEVEVPIDYAAPELGTIQIAINRAQANAAVEYQGVLFLNPGGPGAAGKDFVAGSTPALRTLFPGYDFVGFDPRGVGESAALHCSIPITAFGLLKTEGAQAMIDTLRSESRSCAAENGPLFDKVGSNQVVADIDRIREALGHDEINFLGVSYGTRLAELYAQVFPEHARAVILDAPVSPIADVTEEATAQFDALLTAHEAFFSACAVGQLDCPPDAENVFAGIVASQPTEGDRLQFLTNWKLLLSASPGRLILAELLRSVASGERMSSVEMPVMASVNVIASINFVANLSTNCADSVVLPPTASQAEVLLESFQQRSVEFADQGISAITCSGWQVQPDPVPLLTALRVPPLVIAGLEDSLTPLAWAQDTVNSSPGASLLLSEHYGHSAVLNGSLCVFGYVKRYLDALEPVPAGARCAARTAAAP